MTKQRSLYLLGYCLTIAAIVKNLVNMTTLSSQNQPRGMGGGTLGIFQRGCATGTLEPLTYTRASLAEFCYPILNLTPQIPPPLS